MTHQSETCLTVLMKFGHGCHCICLSLNEKKTKVLVFSNASVSASLDLGSLVHFLKPFATNLEIKVDDTLKPGSQFKAVVKSSFLHLRQLTKIRPILP